jgi:hypothetical protein
MRSRKTSKFVFLEAFARHKFYFLIWRIASREGSAEYSKEKFLETLASNWYYLLCYLVSIRVTLRVSCRHLLFYFQTQMPSIFYSLTLVLATSIFSMPISRTVVLNRRSVGFLDNEDRNLRPHLQRRHDFPLIVDGFTVELGWDYKAVAGETALDIKSIEPADVYRCANECKANAACGGFAFSTNCGMFTSPNVVASQGCCWLKDKTRMAAIGKTSVDQSIIFFTASSIVAVSNSTTTPSAVDSTSNSTAPSIVNATSNTTTPSIVDSASNSTAPSIVNATSNSTTPTTGCTTILGTTGTMGAGNSMAPGQCLVNGDATLQMNTYGELILTKGSTTVWDSKPAIDRTLCPEGAVTTSAVCKMQIDGNFACFADGSATAKPYFATNTSAQIAFYLASEIVNLRLVVVSTGTGSLEVFPL